jgi:anti-sigma-K factor RskA
VLILVLVVVVPVAVVFIARRLADHPAVLVVRDLGIAVYIVARFVYRLGRIVVRYIAGEVRSWQVSRSASRA